MFIDEVHDYQKFVRDNLSLLGPQYTFICEQYKINLGIIDILAYNRKQENLVIIELKNPIAQSSAIMQIISYFYELKDVQLDGYIISNMPELFIIAPNFDKHFILPDNMPIKLIQMSENICQEYDPKAVDFEDDLMPRRHYDVKNKPSIFLSSNQYILIYKLIKCFNKLDNVKIIYQSKCIDIFQNKKIAFKIIYPYGWFNDYIQLQIYNTNDCGMYKFDYAIRKYRQLKNSVKLDIINIPEIIKEKVRNDKVSIL